MPKTLHFLINRDEANHIVKSEKENRHANKGVEDKSFLHLLQINFTKINVNTY